MLLRILVGVTFLSISLSALALELMPEDTLVSNESFVLFAPDSEGAGSHTLSESKVDEPGVVLLVGATLMLLSLAGRKKLPLFK